VFVAVPLASVGNDTSGARQARRLCSGYGYGYVILSDIKTHQRKIRFFLNQ
jgi:hypothetical protein